MKDKQTKKIRIPILKRLFDIILASIILILTLPFSILMLLSIFIEHIFRLTIFAPLFYIETRISQGKPFKLIKFNIFKYRVVAKMKREGKFIHTKELERNNALLVVGYFLKQIYLDELPQLINVLKGDLSIVGPRPANLEVHESLVKKGIHNKDIVRAGITGLFQSQKNVKGVTDIELDSKYINFCANNSSWKILLFDIKIILRTLSVIVKAEGI